MAETKKKAAEVTAEAKEKKTTTKTSKASSKKAAKNKSDILMYKGKPLVRCKNVMYYGDPKDKYVAVFRLEDNSPLEDIQISSKVIVELKSNEGKNSMLIRQAERDGLYKALDVGIYWLEQALEMN